MILYKRVDGDVKNGPSVYAGFGEGGYWLKLAIDGKEIVEWCLPGLRDITNFVLSLGRVWSETADEYGEVK